MVKPRVLDLRQGLYWDDCESVVHVLWECPEYKSIRNTFMVQLESLMGGDFEKFRKLDNFNRADFVLGCENWDGYDFRAALQLHTNFILSIWDMRKSKLYGDLGSDCSCSYPLTGDPTSSACISGCVVNGITTMAAT